MSNNVTKHDPRDFGLTRFGDLLSSRPPIAGEDPGSFDAFRLGILSSLTPLTPYECVVAESLVAIEWELLQRRRMREADLRKTIRSKIINTAMNLAEKLHDAEYDGARDSHWDAFISDGGDEDEWEDPHPFDTAAVSARIEALAEGTLSTSYVEQGDACRALHEMGVALSDLMGDAYAATSGTAPTHDAKVQELERRRREVKRDFDAIQKARPIRGGGGEDDIQDAEVVSP